MNTKNSFVTHYEQELAFLRESGQQFSEEHPSIAASLNWHQSGAQDPHVARMLEGFAFLNARIQQKLDDEVPQVTDGLLNTLYPHYTRPIPSMSIAQFVPSPELDTTETINARTQLHTVSAQGEDCQFETTYPVALQPLSLCEASLMARPFVTPGSAVVTGAEGVLHLRFQALSQGLGLSEASIEDLRLHLSSQPMHAYALYELLFNQTLKVVLSQPGYESEPIMLTPDVIQPVGFGAEEGLLPYKAQSFMGYRLLTEFFTFPEKFLFFDLKRIGKFLRPTEPKQVNDHFDLYIYFAQSDQTLEQYIDEHTFALGCSPIVNLFSHRAEPVELNHESFQYPVVADVRRQTALNIYSVDEVTAVSDTGQVRPCAPIFGLKYQYHQSNAKPQQSLNALFWHTSREHDVSGGSHTHIHLKDLDFNPCSGGQEMLDIQTTCYNGDMPFHWGNQNPAMILHQPEGQNQVSRIHCLKVPTRSRAPMVDHSGRWRLISHLKLNQLSLANSEAALAQLKEILLMYNFSDAQSNHTLINALETLTTRPVMAPVSMGGRSGLCRGTEIALTLNASQLSGHSGFLFSSVLERFFGLYTHINSFTQLKVTFSHNDQCLKHWPPRSGHKQLI